LAPDPHALDTMLVYDAERAKAELSGLSECEPREGEEQEHGHNGEAAEERYAA
jgi:hypothetical protein